MFWKKNDSEVDAFAKEKAIMRIILRRVIAQYPAAPAVIGVVCGKFDEGGDLKALALEALDEYSDVFAKDPMLKADIDDMMTIMGLDMPDIDMDQFEAMRDVLCSLVS